MWIDFFLFSWRKKKAKQKYLWFKIHNLFVHFIKVGCQISDTRIYTTWNTGHKDSLNINKSNVKLIIKLRVSSKLIRFPSQSRWFFMCRKKKWTIVQLWTKSSWIILTWVGNIHGHSLRPLVFIFRVIFNVVVVFVCKYIKWIQSWKTQT